MFYEGNENTVFVEIQPFTDMLNPNTIIIREMGSDDNHCVIITIDTFLRP
jgi:hypothetical protein